MKNTPIAASSGSQAPGVAKNALAETSASMHSARTSSTRHRSTAPMIGGRQRRLAPRGILGTLTSTIVAPGGRSGSSFAVGGIG